MSENEINGVSGEVRVTDDVNAVEEAASTPILDILNDLLKDDAEIIVVDSMEEAREAVQRLSELAAGITGDPKNYSSKKAFAADFKEYRALTIAVRDLMHKLRQVVLPLKQEMLDNIEAGNRPSIDKLEKQQADLAFRIAQAKEKQGKPLTDAEKAILEERS